jgi:hypothetical protein
LPPNPGDGVLIPLPQFGCGWRLRQQTPVLLQSFQGIPEGHTMSSIVLGFVKNGVVVPNSPLPEGAQVEIQLKTAQPEVSPDAAARLSPSELRKLPREQRQAILAAAAEIAEQDYRSDRELTGFEAFSEEERDDDDESESP